MRSCRGLQRDGIHAADFGQAGFEHLLSFQRSLYQFLRQKVHQPGIPLTDDYPMPPGWRELVTAEEALR